MPLVTIIIPAYNEASNLVLLYESLREVTAGMEDCEFEFIFVDDGSSDGTPATLALLGRSDSRVKVIRFSRNFGSHAACLAGLVEAKGEAIAFLAADLQDPPSLIPLLLEKIREGYGVVFAVRSARRDSWLTVRLANLYHSLMRRYAIPGWPAQGADVFMIARPVRDVLVRWGQKNTSIFAQILWMGFRQASIPYVKEERRSGKSKWSTAKKIKLLADSFASFSFSPIRWISYCGVAVVAAGLGSAAFLAIHKLVAGVSGPQWAPLIALLLTISGLQFLGLGIIGEYLWRVADEVRGGPPFVIESRMEPDSSEPAGPQISAQSVISKPVREFQVLSFGEGQKQ